MTIHFETSTKRSKIAEFLGLVSNKVTQSGAQKQITKKNRSDKPAADFHGFDELFALTNPQTQEVSQMLLAETSALPIPMPEIVSHIVSSGGKRIRARLVIASAKLFEYIGKDHATLGAAIEAIHCASLLHDDVVDGSKMRRGLPVANNLWGAQASVLVGDFLFARAFSLMCRQKNFDILKLLAKTAVRLTQGEVRQLYSARALNTKPQECIEIIKDKTGALFRAATLSGAMLAKCSEKNQKNLALFGEKFGLGYQLADDMLDYVAQKNSLGKQRGDDLRDGKITFPLALCIKRADKNEQQKIKKIFANQKSAKAEIDQVTEIMQKYNCLNECKNVAQVELIKSAQAIDGIGNVKIREVLQKTCLESLNRLS